MITIIGIRALLKKLKSLASLRGTSLLNRWDFALPLPSVELESFTYPRKEIRGNKENSVFAFIENGDKDSSFINWHLFSYCETEGIEFSRSRPYKKNDNSFIEQKNSTHARRVIGRLRYDTEKELEIINNLYRNKLRLCKNVFQPVMKLKEKIRDKGKVHRKYDITETCYQRIMESESILKETKDKLTKIYLSLNPVELKKKGR